MMELGPFRVNKDGKTLYQNEYAWNIDANIIFLESPAGVGFSYSNTTSDYNLSGDNRTAQDSYIFLINWLERFPEYKTREFFIAGESYAGHYIPQLAQVILHNEKYVNRTVINLRGIAMGNAYIDFETTIKGVVDFYWTHALMPDEIFHGLTSNCDFTILNTSDKVCLDFVNQAANAVGNIYSYDIYAPLCNSSSKFHSVGGYVVGFQNLTFVTVRGAGHFVPSYQPARALVLFSSFVNGKLPPPA
ncbi:hypothetical protein LWI29_028959 [Acer saccharum]|uniref:Carboxypeptidase n=1 Tax=Acer saccharum TaxID=4024 RepID=A0AA39RS53_ACESA|nr:hypothetical protein LWI29_028959 [Acer saccharum]